MVYGVSEFFNQTRSIYSDGSKSERNTRVSTYITCFRWKIVRRKNRTLKFDNEIPSGRYLISDGKLREWLKNESSFLIGSYDSSRLQWPVKRV